MVAISLLFGVAALLLVWWTYQTVIAVPAEDRTYLDRPPSGFRVAWPVIRMIVHYLGPYVSLRYRVSTHARLLKAGVEYSVSPEQFLAGKLVGAVLGMVLGAWFSSALGAAGVGLIVGLALLGFFYPEVWLRETSTGRERQIFKALPFYIDVITLGVEAGSNLTGAITQAVSKGPAGPLKSELNRVLRDVKAGKPRSQALRAMAERLDMQSVTSLVGSIIQAERTGANLGPVLRAQADQRRSERFTRAEKLAMEAPVKLLGPLIAFIFPNTFVVLLFLILVKAILAGVLPDAIQQPLMWALQWPNEG